MATLSATLAQILRQQKGTIIYAFNPLGLLDVVAFDVTTRRTIEDPGVVASFPVEDDEDGTDNFQIGPPVLTVEGIFTDTPFEIGAASLLGGRARDLYEKILEIRARKEPIHVFTDNRTLPDMIPAIVSLSESADDGDVLPISITFVKSRILSSALVPSAFDLDALLAAGGGVADLGTQATASPFDYTGPITPQG